MSLVVRPKRANKKAIDYAQLANGSMSVEDADESPPPQSAGNGKRKLEPTGGSSKAPKGKAPAGKAPAAVPAPALLIDRDTDLEPLSPEIQAKLLALFREADDLTARWRPTAQTLLASIRSKMVVRAEQSNEYTRTVSRFAPKSFEMVRTEELYTRTETADIALLRILNPAAIQSAFASRHADLLFTNVRSSDTRKVPDSGGGGASSDAVGAVREATHVHILGDESLTSVLLKREHVSYGSKVGGKSLERALRGAGVSVYGASEQAWYFPLLLAAANDTRDKGWLNDEAATTTKFSRLRATLRRIQSAQGTASMIHTVAPGFSLFDFHPRCDYDPYNRSSQKNKKAGKSDASEALKAALRGLGVVFERKAPKRMALTAAQAAHATSVVAGAQTEGETAPLAFLDGRVMVPAETFRLVLECMTEVKETRTSPLETGLQRALIVAVPVVARSWLAASADPALHTRLDVVTGSNNRKLALTTLCQVLRRPKFELVESLSFGKGIKLGKKGAATFAAACPRLKAFTWVQPPSYGDLVQVLESCPGIQDLGFGTWEICPALVARLITKYGGRLLSLDLNPKSAYTKYYVSSSIVRAVADNCRQLQSLTLGNMSCMRDHYEPRMACDGLSEDATIHLLNRCTSLKHLELLRTQRVGARTLQALVGQLRTVPRTTALSSLVVHELPVFEYATPEATGLTGELRELLDKFTCKPAPRVGEPPASAQLRPAEPSAVSLNEYGHIEDEYSDY